MFVDRQEAFRKINTAPSSYHRALADISAAVDYIRFRGSCSLVCYLRFGLYFSTYIVNFMDFINMAAFQTFFSISRFPRVADANFVVSVQPCAICDGRSN